MLWGELSLGKPSVKPFSSVPWLLHLGPGAVPAPPAKPCRLIHRLAVPRAGSCRVWIRQGGQGCAQTSPMLRSSGAPWPPQPLKSSPSALLSADKSVSAPWPGQEKGLQVESLKPVASPEAASRGTSRDLGVLAGKVGKGKGDKMQVTDLVMWEDERRFKGEMTAPVSGESRDANLHGVFPTKLGSFRASGVNCCYFHGVM